MAPASPRTGLNSSTLIRLLADLRVADVASSKQGLTERLGGWLDWTDAIALSAALNSAGTARPSVLKSGAQTPAMAAIEELAQLRADLGHAIATDNAFAADKPGLTAPTLTPGAPVGCETDFSSCRRACLAHQRAMEARIGGLRVRVRAALASLSPELGRLAALDAVLDAALSARERQLLAKVPALLEVHAERQGRAQRDAQSATPEPDGQAAGAQPAAWLARVGQDMQAVLLAELDIRLQPVEGMVEAMRKDATRRR